MHRTTVIDPSHLLWHKNDGFLEKYFEFIEKDYKPYYFAYDAVAQLYDDIKCDKKPNILPLEMEFFAEMKRLHSLVASTLHTIDRDLRSVLGQIESMDLQTKKQLKKMHDDRALERTMRGLFERCRSLQKFYELNYYIIRKMAKKYEKIVAAMLKSHSEVPIRPVQAGPGSFDTSGFGHIDIDIDPDPEFPIWSTYPSFVFFKSKLCPHSQQIADVKQKCIDIYISVFRKKYPSLGVEELKYQRLADVDRKDWRFHYGVKIGIILALVAWLLNDSLSGTSSVSFWTRPGLYVYTSIGNLLLYKLLWSINVSLFVHYNINYISVLQLHNRRANPLRINNENSSWLVLFLINTLIYYRVNCTDSQVYNHSFLRWACPMFLIVSTVGYLIYQRYLTVTMSESLGLFTPKMYANFVMCLFVDPTFRDIFAADYLTSFTKLIADTVRASCWVGTGSFLNAVHSATSDVCTTGIDVTIISSACVLAPLFLRLLQCFRLLLSTGKVFPHAFNMLKYATSMIVVIWGMFESTATGDLYYMVFILMTSLYKWWWDVVMDWGLMSIAPNFERLRLLFVPPINRRERSIAAHERPFLRTLLLFQNVWLYYFCIVLDLVLRFLWVVSLVPVGRVAPFVAPAALKVFLGSVEIFRRSMWGHFRIEYENVKLITNDAPGFVAMHNGNPQNRVDSMMTIDSYDAAEGSPSGYTAAAAGGGRVARSDSFFTGMPLWMHTNLDFQQSSSFVQNGSPDSRRDGKIGMKIAENGAEIGGSFGTVDNPIHNNPIHSRQMAPGMLQSRTSLDLLSAENGSFSGSYVIGLCSARSPLHYTSGEDSSADYTGRGDISSPAVDGVARLAGSSAGQGEGENRHFASLSGKEIGGDEGREESAKSALSESTTSSLPSYKMF